MDNFKFTVCIIKVNILHITNIQDDTKAKGNTLLVGRNM